MRALVTRYVVIPGRIEFFPNHTDMQYMVEDCTLSSELELIFDEDIYISIESNYLEQVTNYVETHILRYPICKATQVQLERWANQTLLELRSKEQLILENELKPNSDSKFIQLYKDPYFEVKRKLEYGEGKENYEG